MTRKLSDFTTGSQLISQFVQMFAVGFKVPLYGAIALYVCLAWYLVHGALGDYELHLVAIKLYAALWGYLELDANKSVAVETVYGGTIQIALSQAQTYPPIARAWGLLTALLVRSAWLTALGIVPATGAYFWFAARFGKSSTARKHQRGRWLATTSELVALARAYNRAARGAELRRALGKGWWLARREELERAGLDHRPFELAGVPWPWREEQTHAMLIGSTGTGKTVAMMDLIDQIRARGQRAVVFDLTGNYVAKFYDETRDTILHPLDRRCPRWSIFDECRNIAEFTAAAEALIPSDGGGDSQFWVQGARTLFTSMCTALLEQGRATNEDLAHSLMTADLETVFALVKDKPAAPMASPDSPRLADSVRAVFNANAQALLYLPTSGRSFSIRDWVAEGKQDGAILFVSARYVDLPICRQLVTLWLNSAVYTLMQGASSSSLRMWFLIDELGALHRLPALEDGMQTARNFGGAFVTGVHTHAKLEATYGKQVADTLSNLAKTKLILGSPDTETSKWCSETIGNGEVQDMNKGYSFNFTNSRDAVNLSPERRDMRIVMPEQIRDLDPLHGYICFPGSLPPASILLEYRARPDRAPGYIARPDFDIVPGSKRKGGTAFAPSADVGEDGDNADDGEGGKGAAAATKGAQLTAPRRRERSARREDVVPQQSSLDFHGRASEPRSDATQAQAEGLTPGEPNGAPALLRPIIERRGRSVDAQRERQSDDEQLPDDQRSLEPSQRTPEQRRKAEQRRASIETGVDGATDRARDRDRNWEPELGDFGP